MRYGILEREPELGALRAARGPSGAIAGRAESASFVAADHPRRPPGMRPSGHEPVGRGGKVNRALVGISVRTMLLSLLSGTRRPDGGPISTFAMTVAASAAALAVAIGRLPALEI